MRNFTLLTICIITSVAIGCNSDPRGRRELALMRSEIMDLEDKYYALKSRHERTLKELGECRGVPVESIDPGLSIVESSSYYVEPGNDCDEFSIDLAPDQTILTTPHSQPKLREPTPASSGEFSLESPARLPTHRQQADELVTEIYINPRHTSAKNVDGQAGDDGLALLLQPRSAAGKSVSVSGAVTIGFIDPAAASGKQRVGRWTFTANEMDLFAVPNHGQPGFLLHLPWDTNAPRNNRLVVNVQFVTPDGRRLKTSKQIRIQPPTGSYSAAHPLIAKWTEQISGATSDSTMAEMNNEPPSLRRGVRAVPAKTDRQINKPEWRPIR